MSPYVNWTNTYSKTNPLRLAVDGLEPGAQTVVDIQLRPKNPDQLWYAFNPMDWPADQYGNIRDLNDSPDDIQLVPMLEITMNDGNYNLPLRDKPEIEMAFESGGAISTTATLRHLPNGMEIDYTIGSFAPLRFDVLEGRCDSLRNVAASSTALAGLADTMTIAGGDLPAFFQQRPRPRPHQHHHPTATSMRQHSPRALRRG